MPAPHKPDGFYSGSSFSEENIVQPKKNFPFGKEREHIPVDQKEAFCSAWVGLSQTLSRMDPPTNINRFYKPPPNTKRPPETLIKAARSILHTISSVYEKDYHVSYYNDRCVVIYPSLTTILTEAKFILTQIESSSNTFDQALQKLREEKSSLRDWQTEFKERSTESPLVGFPLSFLLITGFLCGDFWAGNGSLSQLRDGLITFSSVWAIPTIIMMFVLTVTLLSWHRATSLNDQVDTFITAVENQRLTPMSVDASKIQGDDSDTACLPEVIPN